MKRELRYLQARELRVAKNEDGSRSISGTVCYNSLSLDLGGWFERIAAGAFAESLDDVLCLRDHKPVLLMGRTKSKTLSLDDKDDGLHFSCKLPNTEPANSLAESIDRGDLDGVSFGFSCIEDKWDLVGDDVIRTVLKAVLYEISPCSWAAYPDNSVSVRSALHSCPPELRKKMKKCDCSKRDDGCTCTCPECQDGDCSNCSDDNCTCEGCTCSQRSLIAVSESERTRMYMALTLLERQ